MLRTSTAAIDGPSRRPTTVLARVWIGPPSAVRATPTGGRHLQTSAHLRQDPQVKADTRASAGADVAGSHAGHSSQPDPSIRASEPPPETTRREGHGPATARQSDSASTSTSTAWQLPPAWRSQLDPDAPWRKSLLEHRRRWLDQAGHQLTAVGLKLNEVTGYKEVERLKAVVGEKETRLKWLRDDAKTAKEEYERAVTTRATTQSDVNSLLERKHAWSDEDVSRFTQLVRSDHTSTQAVSTTAITLKDTEIAVDKAFSELMQAILQRYHEEQVWSDKIRNVSTYANLVGLLVNLVVFVGAVAVVEPWKRRRLVERLEERMAGMMERVEGSIAGLGEAVAVGGGHRIRGGSGSDSGGQSVPVVTDTSASTESAGDLAPLLSDGDDLLADSDDHPISDLNTSRPSPSPSSLAGTLNRIAPVLDKLAPPSHDRDLALSASLGVVAGLAVGALSMWAGR